MIMISGESTLKKNRKGLNFETVSRYAYFVFCILFLGTIITARVMENRPVQLKSMYNYSGEFVGYAVNDKLYEFKVKDLPEQRRALVHELKEISIEVLVKPWMEPEKLEKIQNKNVSVKMFNIEKSFLEGFLYTQRCPVGVWVSQKDGTNVIYIQEEICNDKDLFIDVFIHEYIHAMSNGAKAFDYYDETKKEWTHFIVKEAYTDYLADLVVEEAALQEEYNMQKRFLSGYANAKKIACELDSHNQENDGYSVMREIFFWQDEDGYIGDVLGRKYEELNILAKQEPNSERVTELLEEIKSEF